MAYLYIHTYTVIALYSNPTEPFATFSTVRCLNKQRNKQTNKTGRAWARFDRLVVGKLAVCGSHINETFGPIKLHAFRQRIFDFLKSAFHRTLCGSQ
jgi:hypothetical protein